jgi:hypothetical protein
MRKLLFILSVVLAVSVRANAQNCHDKNLPDILPDTATRFFIYDSATNRWSEDTLKITIAIYSDSGYVTPGQKLKWEYAIGKCEELCGGFYWDLSIPFSVDTVRIKPFLAPKKIKKKK